MPPATHIHIIKNNKTNLTKNRSPHQELLPGYPYRGDPAEYPLLVTGLRATCVPEQRGHAGMDPALPLLSDLEGEARREGRGHLLSPCVSWFAFLLLS